MTEQEKTLEEIVEDFVDDLTTKFSQWWENGVDYMPKASDLIERLRSSKYIKD